MTLTNIEILLVDVIQWTRQRSDIRAALLIGSYARGSARSDSDVDILVLTEQPSAYRDTTAWANDFNWSVWRAPMAHWRDADYGPVWSRHFVLQDGSDIEFGFGHPNWAQTEPVDEGTRDVVRNGARIMYDPDGLLKQLLDVCQTT